MSGDLLLWHHWIVHSGTTNAHGNLPRLALFGRWHHKQRETMRYNIAGIGEGEAVDGTEAETLWKDWQLAVRQVAAAGAGTGSSSSAKL